MIGLEFDSVDMFLLIIVPHFILIQQILRNETCGKIQLQINVGRAKRAKRIGFLVRKPTSRNHV